MNLRLPGLALALVSSLSRLSLLSLPSLLLLPGVAFADEGGRAPVRLWVEASTPERICADAASAIAKELVLACDASRGACSLAKTRESATRIVRLHCGDDAAATAESGSEWAFTAYDSDGTQRWTINLFGADADLPRSAAMFAVRFETRDEPRPPTKIETAPAAAPVLERTAPTESSSTGKTLAYVGFGVGTVGLGAGLVAALHAKSKSDDLDNLCKPHCTQADVDDVRKWYTAADVLLVVGAAAAVTGTIGVIMWANTRSSTSTRGKSVSTVRATAGAGWVGLAGSF